jgi:hypothetical protein
MTLRHNSRSGFYLALTLSAAFSLACATNPHTGTATSAETTTTTHLSRPSTTPTQPASGAAPSLATSTAATNAPLPADLHFTPADIQYIQSLDPEARALAIQRQRDNLAALIEAGKLTNGYTDSIKHWSISTAKKPR